MDIEMTSANVTSLTKTTRPPQFGMRTLLVSVLLCGVGFALIRSIPRTQIIESLNNPVSVQGWDKGAIILADGRRIALPDLSTLPESSEALAAATERGVEIDQHGQLYGLVDILHRCVHDPIRRHIARVNISRMLVFLGEGEPRRSFAHDDGLVREGGRFDGGYWDSFEYHMFKWWSTAVSDDPFGEPDWSRGR